MPPDFAEAFVTPGNHLKRLIFVEVVEHILPNRAGQSLHPTVVHIEFVEPHPKVDVAGTGNGTG